MNAIVRPASLLVALALVIAACGSPAPTATPVPTPVATPVATSVPTATPVPTVEPTPAPSVAVASPSASCDPAWYPNIGRGGMSSGSCGLLDLSKCEPGMVFNEICAEIGPLPDGWKQLDRVGRAKMWNQAQPGLEYGVQGGLFEWGAPDTQKICAAPNLLLVFTRFPGLVPDVKAELAAGVANADQWTKTGTKRTGTGDLTVGPWTGLFASYSCPDGKTTITLFAANDGSPTALIFATVTTTAGTRQAAIDFLATFRMQAGNYYR